MLSTLLIGNCFVMRGLLGTPQWQESGLDEAFGIVLVLTAGAVLFISLSSALRSAQLE